MSIEANRKRLAQEKTLQWIQRKLDMDEWVTVRQTPSDDSQDRSIYSTLIPLDKVENQRSHLQEYMPPSGFVTTRFGPNRQQETTGIDRDRKGNQYLIIDRNPGKIEGKEICQDFRFFYNLHLNRDTGEYVLKDFDTKNEVVAVVEANSVKIRFKELHQFLKSKKLYLSLRFVCSEYSEHSLSELGVSENEVEAEEVDLQNGHISWRRFYCETHKDGYQTECSLEARRLIGYAEIPKNTYGFIVGVDKYGNEIRRHPNDLRVRIYEGLGWSPNSIFVDFKKTVLDKYYHNPNKYTVGDCLLTLHNGEVNTPRLPFDDDPNTKFVCYLITLSFSLMRIWRTGRCTVSVPKDNRAKPILIVMPQGESLQSRIDLNTGLGTVTLPYPSCVILVLVGIYCFRCVLMMSTACAVCGFHPLTSKANLMSWYRILRRYSLTP